MQLTPSQIKEYVKDNPYNQLTLIIAASFQYYIANNPIMSDIDFDFLVQSFKADPNKDIVISTSMYGHLVTEDRLSTGSFYDIHRDDYPISIITLLINWIRHGTL